MNNFAIRTPGISWREWKGNEFRENHATTERTLIEWVIPEMKTVRTG